MLKWSYLASNRSDDQCVDKEDHRYAVKHYCTPPKYGSRNLSGCQLQVSSKKWNIFDWKREVDSGGLPFRDTSKLGGFVTAQTRPPVRRRYGQVGKNSV